MVICPGLVLVWRPTGPSCSSSSLGGRRSTEELGKCQLWSQTGKFNPGVCKNYWNYPAYKYALRPQCYRFLFYNLLYDDFNQNILFLVIVVISYTIDRLVFVTRIWSLFALYVEYLHEKEAIWQEQIIKFRSCLMKAWRGKHARKRAKWQGMEESKGRRQRRPKLPKLVWTQRENS